MRLKFGIIIIIKRGRAEERERERARGWLFEIEGNKERKWKAINKMKSIIMRKLQTEK